MIYYDEDRHNEIGEITDEFDDVEIINNYDDDVMLLTDDEEDETFGGRYVQYGEGYQVINSSKHQRVKMFKDTKTGKKMKQYLTIGNHYFKNKKCKYCGYRKK